MSLKQQLTEDMKQAMRDKNSVALNAIRFLISDLRNFEIDNGEQDDQGVQKIIAKQIKQMKDAMVEYEKGGRTDLVEAEQAKIDVITKYLPAQLSDEELTTIINEAISDNPDKNMGKIIGQVMGKAQGKADGGRVSGLVKQLLA
jgi:uncharacterized protein YqeY